MDMYRHRIVVDVDKNIDRSRNNRGDCEMHLQISVHNKYEYFYLVSGEDSLIRNGKSYSLRYLESPPVEAHGLE